MRITNLKSLEVYYRNKKVGTLALTPDNLTAFEYDAEFITDGFSISPFFLPLQSGVFIAKPTPFEGIFGVFNDSLPDGWGMLLMDRILASFGIALHRVNLLDRLSIIGHQTMGALQYKPTWNINEPKLIGQLDEIAKKTSEILNQKYTGSINDLFVHGGSSGGARPKILTTIDHQKWIIKFRSSADPENIGQIEYDYSNTARKCGIEVPPTRLFDNKYFGIVRFDRHNSNTIHMISASGLLHASHRLPSIDYIDLLKATHLLTKNFADVLNLYRLMIFNVITQNKDDHTKNFSFLYKNNQWKLSPAYDLVKSTGFNHQHTTTIAGSGTPEKSHILNVAKQIGIDKKQAINIYDQVFDNTRELVKKYLI